MVVYNYLKKKMKVALTPPRAYNNNERSVIRYSKSLLSHDLYSGILDFKWVVN